MLVIKTQLHSTILDRYISFSTFKGTVSSSNMNLNKHNHNKNKIKKTLALNLRGLKIDILLVDCTLRSIFNRKNSTDQQSLIDLYTLSAMFRSLHFITLHGKLWDSQQMFH